MTALATRWMRPVRRVRRPSAIHIGGRKSDRGRAQRKRFGARCGGTETVGIPGLAVPVSMRMTASHRHDPRFILLHPPPEAIAGIRLASWDPIVGATNPHWAGTARPLPIARTRPRPGYRLGLDRRSARDRDVSIPLPARVSLSSATDPLASTARRNPGPTVPVASEQIGD